MHLKKYGNVMLEDPNYYVNTSCRQNLAAKGTNRSCLRKYPNVNLFVVIKWDILTCILLFINSVT